VFIKDAVLKIAFYAIWSPKFTHCYIQQ